MKQMFFFYIVPMNASSSKFINLFLLHLTRHAY